MVHSLTTLCKPQSQLLGSFTWCLYKQWNLWQAKCAGWLWFIPLIWECCIASPCTRLPSQQWLTLLLVELFLKTAVMEREKHHLRPVRVHLTWRHGQMSRDPFKDHLIPKFYGHTSEKNYCTFRTWIPQGSIGFVLRGVLGTGLLGGYC